MQQKNCVFCEKPAQQILLENSAAKVFFDIHPMAKGHLLIVPKQHYRTWFDIPEEEQFQLIQLLNQAKRLLDEQFVPRGYQVFSHVGRIAGQRVDHAHIHLVPVY